MVYATIPYTEKWKLCTIIDDTKIHSHTQTIITTIVFFGIIITGLSIIVISKQSKKMAKPLELLTENMNQVKKGEFIPIETNNNIKEFAYLESSYNEMVVKISQLIQEIYKQQNIARQSELRALQSQINPHFLYNSLDTIKWKAQDYEDDKIYSMVESLSNFFRISLSDGNEIITINQELMHTKYYLEILKIRYEDTMDFEIVVEDNVKNCECLKIIVQPLVENALYHGLKNSIHKGLIKVNAFINDDNIYIEIKDNGIGITSEKLIKINNDLKNKVHIDHYGLYNINERLSVKYNNKFGFKIESEINEGTKITISFPHNSGISNV